MVVDALAGLKEDLAGRYYSLTQMTDKEQQQLIDVSDAGMLLYSMHVKMLYIIEGPLLTCSANATFLGVEKKCWQYLTIAFFFLDFTRMNILF